MCRDFLLTFSSAEKVSRLQVRFAGGESQGNLPGQAMPDNVKFRARGT